MLQWIFFNQFVSCLLSYVYCLSFIKLILTAYVISFTYWSFKKCSIFIFVYTWKKYIMDKKDNFLCGIIEKDWIFQGKTIFQCFDPQKKFRLKKWNIFRFSSYYAWETFGTSGFSRIYTFRVWRIQKTQN